MAKSAFRYRRIQIVVDTTDQAEWDMDGFRIPNSQREAVARSLRAMPISPRDSLVNGVRVRELGGYQWIFIVTREETAIAVTIGGVEVPDPEKPVEKLLKKANMLAMIRSATGI